jgi:hypothetical protein
VDRVSIVREGRPPRRRPTAQRPGAGPERPATSAAPPAARSGVPPARTS